VGCACSCPLAVCAAHLERLRKQREWREGKEYHGVERKAAARVALALARDLSHAASGHGLLHVPELGVLHHGRVIPPTTRGALVQLSRGQRDAGPLSAQARRTVFRFSSHGALRDAKVANRNLRVDPRGHTNRADKGNLMYQSELISFNTLGNEVNPAKRVYPRRGHDPARVGNYNASSRGNEWRLR
jgi:hypothetical protein